MKRLLDSKEFMKLSSPGKGGLNDKTSPSQMSTKISEGTDSEPCNLDKDIALYDHKRTDNRVNNKEKELLKAMGWSEENSEDEIDIDENEIKKLREQLREIKASREKQRDAVCQKFKSYVQGSNKN